MKSNKKISQIIIIGIKEAYTKEGGDFYHETLKVSHGKSPAQLRLENCSIIATITGVDGRTCEAINHVHAYSSEEIIWHQRFKGILLENPQSDGQIVDLTMINEIESTKRPKSHEAYS